MTTATMTSGHGESSQATSPAARTTAALPIASFRVNSQTARTLASPVRCGGCDVAQVPDRLARAHLAQVDATIDQLVALRAGLDRIIGRCERVGPVAECSIIAALGAAEVED
jgi:hypothetical protein